MDTAPTTQIFSAESEEALLGAILIDPSIINKISLEADQLFIVRNKWIYKAMRDIGLTVDLVSLSELLERRGQLSEVGGLSYLTHLINTCPNAYNYETYERIINDSAARREVVECASELVRAAYEEGKTIWPTVSTIMTRLANSARPKGGALSIRHYLSRLYEQIEERAHNPRQIYGLETGVVDFDRITSGLQKGEEFILAGQPGAGKSLLAFQMACGMAAAGHPGAVYSLEMTGVAMVMRRISAISRIPTYNLRSGVDMNDHWDSFLEAFIEMEKLPIMISDASNWTTLQMRADLSRLKQQEGIEWFVLDYHDLLGDLRSEDRNERTAHISQQLHGICKDLDLAGLIIQSLNKAGYHTTPTMANLSGSTTVMHTADNIAFMVEDQQDKNVVHLIWDKIREGDGKRAMRLIKTSGYPAFENYIQEPDIIRDWTR